jgi:signal peptidase II
VPPVVERGSARLFWGTAATVIAIDLITKLLAERYLAPRYVPHRIIGDFVRFTLAYNPGAAFSMSLGPFSRYIFGGFAVIALIVLWRLYRLSGPAKRAGDRVRILALGLAWGGAAGNLVDRIRSPLGVVDFIDIGLSSWRFWTFNVADSAVTVGAIVLAWSLSQEEREERHAREAASHAPSVASESDVRPGASGPEA